MYSSIIPVNIPVGGPVSRPKSTFVEYKDWIVYLVQHGMGLNKGSTELMGLDAKPMQLKARARGATWHDSAREHGADVGFETTADMIGVNVDSMLPGMSKSQVLDAQAVTIGVEDTFDAEVHVMKAGYLLVTANVDKDTQGPDREVSLFSVDFINGWAIYNKMAGMVVIAPHALCTKFRSKVFEPDFDEADDETEKKQQLFAAKQDRKNAALLAEEQRIDAFFLCDDKTWKDDTSRWWAHHFLENNLTVNTNIAVYTNVQVMPSGEDFAMYTQTIGGDAAFRLSSAGAAGFGLAYSNISYSSNLDRIQRCSGVYKSNPDTKKIEMCGLHLTATATKFDDAGLASMHDATMPQHSVPTPSREDATTTYLPFKGNTEYRSTFFSLLVMSVSPKQDDFEDEDEDEDEEAYEVEQPQLRCPTRSIGGGKIRGKRQREESPEDRSAMLESGMSYANVTAGKKLFDMSSEPQYYNMNLKRLAVPSFSLNTLLVTDDTERYITKDDLTEDELATKATNLVMAIAKQKSMVDGVLAKFAQADLSGIQESALAVKHCDMTATQLSQLAETKQDLDTKFFNQGVTFFGV